MPRVCITVPGKNSQPYRFSLERKIVRLGRAADNDIIIDCPSVSSHHCEMRRVEGGYTLQDLDSTNGIKADGSRMEVLDLKNEVEVTIGDADLDFELTDDERADLKRESHKSHAKAKLPPISDDEDEDDAEDEEKPRPKKKKRVAPAPAPAPSATPSLGSGLASAHQPGGGASFAISMIFLLLAAAAFFFGMSARHNSKFERSLWNDLFGGPPATEESAETE
jgi:predicted component of type VI protein secretion system